MATHESHNGPCSECKDHCTTSQKESRGQSLLPTTQGEYATIMLSSDFRILCHHVYEYRKGLRNLVLHTMKNSEREAAEALLRREQIDYIVQPVSPCRFNVYFGAPKCVKIIKLFHITQLTNLSDEQDFILGIMLGYSRDAQYERYLHRKKYL